MAAVSGFRELAVDARPALSARVRSDAALVRAAQRGSGEAFDELFARHWPRAYRTACLVCGDADAAEDVTQEAFLAAIRALDRFDRRRPFGPWLHRIVVNRAIDHTRARALRRGTVNSRLRRGLDALAAELEPAVREGLR
jgi:DNA-directed RNA polymerase specialized sigma24 family protein